MSSRVDWSRAFTGLLSSNRTGTYMIRLIDANPVTSDLREAFGTLRSSESYAWKFAWVAFLGTSAQLAFLFPSVGIILGERAKVFSGILCASTLLVTLIAARRQAVRWQSPDVLISLILTLLLVLSSIFSLSPRSSSARGFVMLASGIGGFWCARILLADERAKKIFRAFSLLLLVGLLVLSLIGHFMYGHVEQLLDSNPHPLASRILLLWFAPLSLVLPAPPQSPTLFAVLIVTSYAIFLMSDLRSACLIPVGLLFVAALLKYLSPRRLLAVLVPLAVVLVVFFMQLPQTKIGKEFEPAYYRFENYFFSLHIASKHSWLGIGLTAPRDQFLEGYQIKYPYVTKEKYADSVKRIRASENAFLSIAVDVGVPFVILYTASVLMLVGRLFHLARDGSETKLFHPLVLLLPILGYLLYLVVWDGLYFPQTSWFFHVLLGMIPPADRSK